MCVFLTYIKVCEFKYVIFECDFCVCFFFACGFRAWSWFYLSFYTLYFSLSFYTLHLFLSLFFFFLSFLHAIFRLSLFTHYEWFLSVIFARDFGVWFLVPPLLLNGAVSLLSLFFACGCECSVYYKYGAPFGVSEGVCVVCSVYHFSVCGRVLFIILSVCVFCLVFIGALSLSSLSLFCFYMALLSECVCVLFIIIHIGFSLSSLSLFFVCVCVLCTI